MSHLKIVPDFTFRAWSRQRVISGTLAGNTIKTSTHLISCLTLQFNQSINASFIANHHHITSLADAAPTDAAALPPSSTFHSLFFVLQYFIIVSETLCDVIDLLRSGFATMQMITCWYPHGRRLASFVVRWCYLFVLQRMIEYSTSHIQSSLF